APTIAVVGVHLRDPPRRVGVEGVVVVLRKVPVGDQAVDAGVADGSTFRDALIRIREAEGAYFRDEGAVSLFDDTLFRTSIALPANLVEGAYEVRIFLTRDLEVISQFRTEIEVRKVGLERFLYTLAHEARVAYGLMSLAIAIFAGWAASAVFQLFRR
ncbi:MAG: TIGR02186 family protein, partial [Shimia sp.]